ncbi:hypothetical protein GQ44DRAFT_779932 [Phaeosphaeriaceae sp. PMI808]|nr:hypothetical protein GQ44DRAFT_779932 [Phaeosphaeriaceae sp. PMI808]
MKTTFFALLALPAVLALPALQQEDEKVTCACRNPADGTIYQQLTLGLCEYAYQGTLEADGWCTGPAKYIVGRWDARYCSYFPGFPEAVCKPA